MGGFAVFMSLGEAFSWHNSGNYRLRFEQESELERIFSNLTTYAPFPATRVVMPDTGKNKEVTVIDVSNDFFETLGWRPMRGSDFIHGEIKTG